MDSAALAGGVLVLHLLAVEALAPSCARGEAGAVAATLGLRASFDSTFAANETVQSVEFVHGGKSLTPVSLERLPVQRLWGGGLREAGSQWIRAVIRLDDLSVRADAGMTDLTIEVQLGPDGLRDRVVVPTQVLLDFWLAELPRRSEGLRAAPQQFALSVPRDDRLRAARESFAKGDLADAIQNSLERVKGPGLTDADRVFAYTQMALGFAAAGDSIAARAAFAVARNIEPCVGLASSAPAAFQALLATVPRPAARCYSNSTAVTSLRAALLPGFGRPSTQRWRANQFAVAAAVAGTALVSTFAFQESNDRYQEYLAWQYIPAEQPALAELEAIYGDAESAQRLGVALRAAAIGIYVTQLGWSVLAERRHAARLRSVEAMGGSFSESRVSFTPIVAPGRTGLALTVSW